MSDTTAPELAHTTPLAETARSVFLDRYTGGTRGLYELDLRIWFSWCQANRLDPLEARRPHLEAFGQWLMSVRGNSPRSAARRLQTLRGFYRLAAADELIDRDPTVMLRLPKWEADPDRIAWLDRFQMGALLRAAEATSPAHHALVALMGMLGLRVSEACQVYIEDYAADELGYRVLRIIGKGGKPATMPVPVPLLRILEAARGDRTSGPLILTRAGNQQTRRGAYDWIKRLCRKADLPDTIHPHSLRHAAVTALVDSGADLWEAQRFARHADPRTTEHYYRRKDSLDKHGAHITARLFASAM